MVDTGQLSGSQVRNFLALAITALGRKVLIVLHWDDRTTSTIHNIHSGRWVIFIILLLHWTGGNWSSMHSDISSFDCDQKVPDILTS